MADGCQPCDTATLHRDQTMNLVRSLSVALTLLGLFLSAHLFAFDGDDFVSANHDPKHPDEPAIVLRVPKVDQRASL